ncbi:MAG: hypothetical protein HKN16_01140 [Saprospiraceae bacterium]|nr:hypothetical protein [Saprospiraceae bacterium]
MEIQAEGKYLKDVVALPCPSCGSQLKYSASQKQISCDHCGYHEDINPESDQVVEKTLDGVGEEALNFVPEQFDKAVYHCQNCGSNIMVEPERVKMRCGFCGSDKVNAEAYDHKFIQPVGIIPFYVSLDQAQELFEKWIQKGLFHPTKLGRRAAVENLHGVYVPFWTYDAHSESDWSGQAGYYYHETRMVRINGRMQQQQVQKIRWQHKSGHLSHFFDDILVVASSSIPQPMVEKILPFRLEEVVNFDPRLMIGWEAEVYQTEVDQGYLKADQIMDYKIRHMCSAQLGGDTQRNLYVNSEKSDQTYKHIILPVWICSYIYQNKVYRFLVNGQTGRVYGQKPLSWIKIAFAVLLFLAFIAAIIWARESGVFKN